jgi:hypothetical protein
MRSPAGTQVAIPPMFCNQRPAAKPRMLSATMNQSHPRTNTLENRRSSDRPGNRLSKRTATFAAAKSSSDGK